MSKEKTYPIDDIKTWLICAIRSKDQESLKLISKQRETFYQEQPKMFFNEQELFYEIQYLASSDENILILKYFIETLKINFKDCKDNIGHGLLHHACSYGATKSALFLIKQGYDINASSLERHTPLALATITNRQELLAALAQDKQAKKTIKVDKQGFNSNTALHYAAYYKSSEAAEILIKKFGANIYIKNNHHMTYLDISRLSFTQNLPKVEATIPSYPMAIQSYKALSLYNIAMLTQEESSKQFNKSVEYAKKTISLIESRLKEKNVPDHEDTMLSNYLIKSLIYILDSTIKIDNLEQARNISEYLVNRAHEYAKLGHIDTQTQYIFISKVRINLAITHRSVGNDILAYKQAISALDASRKYSVDQNTGEQTDLQISLTLGDIYFVLGLILIDAGKCTEAIDYLEQVPTISKHFKESVTCIIYGAIKLGIIEYETIINNKLQLIEDKNAQKLYTILYNMHLHPKNMQDHLAQLEKLSFDETTEYHEYNRWCNIKRDAYIELGQYKRAQESCLENLNNNSFVNVNGLIFLIIELLNIYQLTADWEAGLKLLNKYHSIYNELDNVALNILRCIFLSKNNIESESDDLLDSILISCDNTEYKYLEVTNIILFKIYDALNVGNTERATKYFSKLPKELQTSHNLQFLIDLVIISQAENLLDLEKDYNDQKQEIIDTLENSFLNDKYCTKEEIVESVSLEEIVESVSIEEPSESKRSDEVIVSDEGASTSTFLEFLENSSDQEEFLKTLTAEEIHKYFSYKKKILLTKNKKNNSYITTKEISPESFGYKSKDISLTPIYSSGAKSSGESKFFAAISPKLKKSLGMEQLALFEEALTKGKASKAENSIGVKFIFGKGVELKINGDARLYTNEIIQNKEGDKLIVFTALIPKHTSMTKALKQSKLVVTKFDQDHAGHLKHSYVSIDENHGQEEEGVLVGHYSDESDLFS